MARWVKVEFNLFIIYVKYIVALNEELHGGNAWAQAIHDGTHDHLENGEHYQAIGVSFAAAFRNWTVALAAAHCEDGHSPAVARLLKTTLEDFGITMDMVHSSAEDSAALAVATALLLEREGCPVPYIPTHTK